MVVINLSLTLLIIDLSSSTDMIKIISRRLLRRAIQLPILAAAAPIDLPSFQVLWKVLYLNIRVFNQLIGR